MKQKIIFKLFVLGILLLGSLATNAQDPTRFKNQVDELFNAEYNFSPDKKLVIFTGSSSVRMWKDVQQRFPEYNIINNGFGGSQFSDLIYFYDELITKRTPEILFIYEGDNDIASDKKPNKILKEAKGLIARIQRDLPQTKVVFISPKPSIARENLKKDYIKLNKKLKKYCEKQENLEFADVWNIMLDENGNVYTDIFIEDGLHMNKKGYDLWAKVIGEFL
ncbi:MAG: G-D-S-L family lipolytic protein [Prolixibacteraceae bacterium]|jgi:lysophospholipase L1-like esterase|nr:G-D-S-L family lipolytic protein [Prolixibacteraceae bacterium]MBT6006730.1 G-D-S-L family lipolytic protein [Prolixibacteraceae bacterium]MBT6764755.1 G-D-S-L family lipolytic protein [Prolixibacteraceae bacterium]MBT6996826.1 G-D-S-L family lipolytic protein [Prolixibacteraceae bacterium]MBT7395291.1 G-D-S-L family lipolytic protein [Prolixibacteraceae bacterium]